MNPDRWIHVNEPAHAGEEFALNFLRDNLPATEPYRAWGPFQFAQRGKLAEVDCVVVAPKGIFLIEIKSYLGEVSGTATDWIQENRQGPRREKNPYLTADMRAKWLKGALRGSKAFKKNPKELPYVQALVFMAGSDFVCRLPKEARTGITGYDQDVLPAGVTQGGGLPGIIEAIVRSPGRSKVNAELSARIAEAIYEVGGMPSTAHLKVGPAVIDGAPREDEQTIEYSAHGDASPNDEFLVVFQKRGDGSAARNDAAAEAAATLEYSLLSHPETQHVGLPKAVGLELDHRWGPAVVLAIGPAAMPLNEFLEREKESLTAEQRTDLLQRIADALREAHRSRMFHRTLSPDSVYVFRSEFGYWQPVITGWHKGMRAAAAEGGPAALGGSGATTLDPGSPSEAAFQAPETSAGAAEPQALDIFSAGALAYLILTGSPPPTDVTAALEADGGFLDAKAVLGPDADPYIVELIREATQEDPGDRTPNMSEFCSNVAILGSSGDEVPAAIDAGAASGGKSAASAAGSAKASVPSEPEVLEPGMIRAGLKIGGFTFDEYLSQGSTAIASSASRDSDGRVGVLKVSSQPEYDASIKAEGTALSEIRSRTVIQLLAGPFELGGRQAIFLRQADLGTLREQVEGGERPSDDEVFRWGIDLLSALVDIESAGVLHRDIKPENIGLLAIGNSDQATLLDFSLVDAPITALQLGTPPYLDPFLERRPEPSYDHAADRYSAAIVLHELLTGSVPRWGDETKAAYLSELRLADELFPADSALGLREFFVGAMAAEVSERFNSAAAMRRAWEDAFTKPPETVPSPDVEAIEARQQAIAENERLSEQLRELSAELESTRTAQAEVQEAAAKAMDAVVATAPEGEPVRQSAIVVDTVGQRLRLSFRKPRSQVSPQETEELNERISEAAASEPHFNVSTGRWRLSPTLEVARLILALDKERGVRIRDRAWDLINRLLEESAGAQSELVEVGDEGQTQASGAGANGAYVQLGEFQLKVEPIEEEIQDAASAGSDGAAVGSRKVYEVDGPDGVRVLVADECLADGSRQIRMVDTCQSGDRFNRLVQGLRLGIREHGSALEVMLDQARMTSDVWSTKRKASEAELEAGAHADVLAELRALGATKTGTRHELLGKRGPHMNKLCAIFPQDKDLVPVAAYVMTRVAPVYSRIPD